jgi:hypothetical protein
MASRPAPCWSPFGQSGLGWGAMCLCMAPTPRRSLLAQRGEVTRVISCPARLESVGLHRCAPGAGRGRRAPATWIELAHAARRVANTSPLRRRSPPSWPISVASTCSKAGWRRRFHCYAGSFTSLRSFRALARAWARRFAGTAARSPAPGTTADPKRTRGNRPAFGRRRPRQRQAVARSRSRSSAAGSSSSTRSISASVVGAPRVNRSAV